MTKRRALLLAQEHVGRLEVPMHAVAQVEVVHTSCNV
jgi:hypothetical protein